ncbi:adenine phosphoribosyltransferase [Fibrobacter sp. UWB16]|jgi:adenine phosphoribosyltransferase|uniref:adenine phosphoribosyltransferase n=1 Tax=unclassified Fibrobacter TaxID=2634177 RepID=UPI000B524A2C|nr:MULTISPECIES: adenine phosphoribosyltransferase [unclassified Fibrobacter]OWV16666.1 adenine phosphoribosyltransferase [Fibrobacter sp. UWB3]SOD14524.1 adenine phosphoribosyltransferase [Fibrobacter sp. UWB16]
MKRIEDYIIAVPDFPKPGVLFRDITGILSDPDGLKLTLDAFYKTLENVDFDVVVGLEARGFLFGVPIAEHFHKPFVPERKKGKLPRETVEITYNLEYGTACMEVHKDAIKPGQRVVIVDDLLATGGTAKAAAHLVEKMGGKVECFAFVIELADLKGREVLDGYRVESLTKF